MAKTETRSIVRAAFARWPIVIVAALVVGAAALGYGLLTSEGPSQEAVSAVRVETVSGLPVQPTVDMGVGMAKSLSTQQAAADEAGVDLAAITGVTAYADPNDVQVVRIAVSADGAQDAEKVADALADEVQLMLLGLLEPDLGYQRSLLESAEERLEEVEQNIVDAEDRYAAEGLSLETQLSLESYLTGMRNVLWSHVDRLVASQFTVDRYESVALVEGEAIAVEVDDTGNIVALTIQGLLIGTIVGLAVAFILAVAETRKSSSAS